MSNTSGPGALTVAAVLLSTARQASSLLASTSPHVRTTTAGPFRSHAARSVVCAPTSGALGAVPDATSEQLLSSIVPHFFPVSYRAAQRVSSIGILPNAVFRGGFARRRPVLQPDASAANFELIPGRGPNPARRWPCGHLLGRSPAAHLTRTNKLAGTALLAVAKNRAEFRPQFARPPSARSGPVRSRPPAGPRPAAPPSRSRPSARRPAPGRARVPAPRTTVR